MATRSIKMLNTTNITKMQIETTMQNYLTPENDCSIQKTDTLVRIWRKENFCTLVVGMQICAAIIERVRRILQKVKIEPPYDPTIPLWDELNMSDIALPGLSQHCSQQPGRWEQSTPPSTEEWIKKLWYIGTIHYCLAT